MRLTNLLTVGALALAMFAAAGGLLWFGDSLVSGFAVLAALLLGAALALPRGVRAQGAAKPKVTVISQWSSGSSGAAVVALGLNGAAYLAEVYRAGIQAVDPGQREAAQMLGLRRTQVMRDVILPQAVPVVLPPMGNYLVSLLKDTSIASLISAPELMLTAISQRTRRMRHRLSDPGLRLGRERALVLRR